MKYFPAPFWPKDPVLVPDRDVPAKGFGENTDDFWRGPRLILYNQRGETFPLAEEDWRKLLDKARRNGWKPAGTAGPPVCLQSAITPTARFLSEDWNQDYERPKEQIVLRHDAKALAAALRRDNTGTSLAIEKSFVSFCEREGFLLSPAVAMGSQLIDLHDSLESSFERSDQDSDEEDARYTETRVEEPSL